jgi:hypothetical protein
MSDPSAAGGPPPATGNTPGRVFGIILLVVGILLTGFSGLCTVGITIADLSQPGHGGGDINLSGIQFIVGGPFILIGALMCWGGWAMSRKKKPPTEAPKDVE